MPGAVPPARQLLRWTSGRAAGRQRAKAVGGARSRLARLRRAGAADRTPQTPATFEKAGARRAAEVADCRNRTGARTAVRIAGPERGCPVGFHVLARTGRRRVGRPSRLSLAYGYELAGSTDATSFP